MQANYTNRSGSAILDSAPPSPAEKIFPSTAAPGDDTASLLGEDIGSEDGMGSILNQPGNKLLLAVAAFMQAANLADSVSPGFVPEPVKMWIASAMEQAPMIVEQTARQNNPMALLSAVGASAAPGASPFGMPAMQSPVSPSPMMGGGMGAGAGMPMMVRPGGRPPFGEEEEEDQFA